MGFVKMLKVKRMGDKVQGVVIRGNPANPEPIHFRVVLPFGEVDISRTSDGGYWVHTTVNRPSSGHHIKGQTRTGCVVDARVDAHNKPAGTLDPGVLADPHLYHLALRLGPDRCSQCLEYEEHGRHHSACPFHPVAVKQRAERVGEES